MTLQLAELTSKRPSNTTHVKAEDPKGDCLSVAQRRNVKGNGSSREGQSADDKQAVEWKGSCKRSSTNTGVRSVSIFYDGVPGPVAHGSRRRMAPPSPRDTAIDERLCEWYLRWLRWAVMLMDARLSAKLLEWSHSLRNISGARRRRPKREGVQESKSRYSWNCGDLRQEHLEGPGFLVSLKRSATWAVAQAVRIMVLGKDCSGVLVLSSDNHTNGV